MSEINLTVQMTMQMFNTYNYSCTKIVSQNNQSIILITKQTNIKAMMHTVKAGHNNIKCIYPSFHSRYQVGGVN